MIGEKIANARKRAGRTQEQLAMNLPISRESLAKYETGDRTLQKDVRKHISEEIDDPDLYFDMWNEATGVVSIPILNGEYIDTHPASMSYLVQHEMDEALEHVRKTDWIKPTHVRTPQERQEMHKVIMELLDAICSMKNLIAVICKEYNFSMKEIYQTWKATLKARRWKK